MLDAYMQRLAQEMEVDLSSLKTATSGVYTIPVDQQTSVKITELPGFVTIDAVIATCPTKSTEEFYTNVLLGNLMGQGTGGATLSLNEQGNLLMLSHSLENNIDYKAFKDVLEDFLNTIDLWRSEIQDYEVGKKG